MFCILSKHKRARGVVWGGGASIVVGGGWVASALMGGGCGCISRGWRFGVALEAVSFVSAPRAFVQLSRVLTRFLFLLRPLPTDPFIREAFRGFLNKHFAEDILRFWKDLDIIKSLPDNDVALPGLAGLMCQDYVRTVAPLPPPTSCGCV